MSKSFETIEKTFDDMAKEWEKEHPLRHWVDDTLFKDVSGIAGYRASYALTHPWKIVENWCYEVKWAWQRVFRGWDDRVVWGIDEYLCDMLPVWLMRLKDVKSGVPSLAFDENAELDEHGGWTDAEFEIANKKYDDVLDKISSGFKSHGKIMKESLYKNDPEYYELMKQFNEGFDLFKEYFGTLWD